MWTSITMTNDPDPDTFEVPVDLARVAHDLRLTPGPRSRDAGRWHALARRFTADRQLIVTVPGHGEHVWVGNRYSQRLYRPDTFEYGMLDTFVRRSGEKFGLAAPPAVRVTIRAYGPAPSPDAYGIERLPVAPDVDAIRDRAVGGHARWVTHWTSILDGDRRLWVAHTARGDRVYFDPDVVGSHADADWIELDGTMRPASAWDRGGACVGVLMPVRHAAAVWQ